MTSGIRSSGVIAPYNGNFPLVNALKKYSNELRNHNLRQKVTNPCYSSQEILTKLTREKTDHNRR